MFVIIVFYLGTDRSLELLFFRVGGNSFNPHASLLASLSVSLSHFILAVPMRECLGKHSCMSSTFPAAKLNDTNIFPTVQLQVHDVYRSDKVEIVKH